jgi:hypothetical protein
MDYEEFMKTKKTMKAASCLILATLSFSVAAKADNGTQTQITAQQMNGVKTQHGSGDASQEGLDTTLTASQWDTVRVYAINSKAQLSDLLERIQPMPFGQAKVELQNGIAAVVNNSDPKATELMMRYVLNRGIDIVKQIDADKLATPDHAGVLDQEVRVLKRSIGFALEYYQDDLKYLNAQVNGVGSLVSPPRAEFGVRCAQFMMKLNRSLLASRAQYKIALDTLGRLSVDLYNDDERSRYGVAMGKIYLYQQTHKVLPKTSAAAIAGQRDLLEVYDQVLNSLRSTPAGNAIVADTDVSAE